MVVLEAVGWYRVFTWLFAGRPLVVVVWFLFFLEERIVSLVVRKRWPDERRFDGFASGLPAFE